MNILREEENLIRARKVIDDDVQPRLRAYFKQRWNARISTTQAAWSDSSNDGKALLLKINRHNHKVGKLIKDRIESGNTEEWDATCLFEAILALNIDKKASSIIRELRNLRNKIFHRPHGKLSDTEKDDFFAAVRDAYKKLGWPADDLNKIETLTITTKEMKKLKVQLENEKRKGIRPSNEPFSPEGFQNGLTQEAKVAKDIAKEFIYMKVGRQLKDSPRRETEIMLSLSEELEKKHDMLLKSMCNRLDINAENGHKTFCEISEEVFVDDINWGRIVVLYTFAGRLAVYCNSNKMESMVDIIIQWVGDIVGSKQLWIKEKGNGWAGFVETFRDEKTENEKLWFQSLVATTLGLGTLAAAFYIRS